MPPLPGSTFNPLLRIPSGSDQPHRTRAPSSTIDLTSSPDQAGQDKAVSSRNNGNEGEEVIQDMSRTTNTETGHLPFGARYSSHRLAQVCFYADHLDVPTPVQPAKKLTKAEETARKYRHDLSADDQRLAGFRKGSRAFDMGQESHCTFESPFPGRMLIAILSGTGTRDNVGCWGTLHIYDSKRGNRCSQFGEYPDLFIPFSLIENIILFKVYEANELFSFRVIIVPIGAVGASSALESSPRCIDFKKSTEKAFKPERIMPYLEELVTACSIRLALFGRQITEARYEDSIKAMWDVRQLDHNSPSISKLDDHVTVFFVPDAIFVECRSSRHHLYIPFRDGVHGASSIALLANVVSTRMHHSFWLYIEGITESPLCAGDAHQATQKRSRIETNTQSPVAPEGQHAGAATRPNFAVFEVNSFDQFDRLWAVIQRWHQGLTPSEEAPASSAANGEDQENRVLLGQKRPLDDGGAGNAGVRQVEIHRAQLVWYEGRPLPKCEEYVEYNKSRDIGQTS
ncbi:hypothetical protein LTR10_004165 [Elasticomyces elasticus]|nr:hypothetical protein LTR10_004165 [Elasticomyces elasticus]KAK4977652.1 hypothetical protein LTR42_002023 [Elasticomyces elasticus]